MHGNVRNGTGHGKDCRMTGRFPRQGIMYGPGIGPDLLFPCRPFFQTCLLDEGGLPAYRLLVGFHILAHLFDFPVVPVEFKEVFQLGDAFGRCFALHRSAPVVV